jgi:hypothetical protein
VSGKDVFSFHIKVHLWYAALVHVCGLVWGWLGGTRANRAGCGWASLLLCGRCGYGWGLACCWVLRRHLLGVFSGRPDHGSSNVRLVRVVVVVWWGVVVC